MGMSNGGSIHTAVSEINVTPLIDVLLVLLIIFMVIVPVAPKGMASLIPQPPKDRDQETEPPRTIVVQVLGSSLAPAYKINDESFTKASLEPKLAEIFATRVEKVMFIKGEPEMEYGEIAEVIDLGHQAGVNNIGIITPRVAAGR